MCILYLQHSLPADVMSVHSSECSRWNKSEQALRYENEQENLDKSRNLKRVSAVSHAMLIFDHPSILTVSMLEAISGAKTYKISFSL